MTEVPEIVNVSGALNPGIAYGNGMGNKGLQTMVVTTVTYFSLAVP